MEDKHRDEWAWNFIYIRGVYFAANVGTRAQQINLIKEVVGMMDKLKYDNPGKEYPSSIHKDIKEARWEPELQDGSKYRVSISWKHYPEGTKKIIPLFLDVMKVTEGENYKDFFINFDERKPRATVKCPIHAEAKLTIKKPNNEKSKYKPSEAFLSIYCPECMETISELDIRNKMLEGYVLNPKGVGDGE
jgi:hypothetical protein